VSIIRCSIKGQESKKAKKKPQMRFLSLGVRIPLLWCTRQELNL